MNISVCGVVLHTEQHMRIGINFAPGNVQDSTRAITKRTGQCLLFALGNARYVNAGIVQPAIKRCASVNRANRSNGIKFLKRDENDLWHTRKNNASVQGQLLYALNVGMSS